MNDKTYIFQFGTRKRGIEVIDSDLITLDRAKELWKENYPKAIEYLTKGYDPQMVIWSDMDENYMFDWSKTVAMIDYDYTTDGENIFPPPIKPKAIPREL